MTRRTGSRLLGLWLAAATVLLTAGAWAATLERYVVEVTPDRDAERAHFRLTLAYRADAGETKRDGFKFLGTEAGQDMQGWELEEFGLPLNLMLAVPCVIVIGDADAALQRLRQDVDVRRLCA